MQATMKTMTKLTNMITDPMMNVEVETRAPPYLARQMSRVAYADIGDAHTTNLFGSGHEGVLTSTPREDPDDPHKEHTQSTQEHFLPRFRPPFG